MNIKSATYVKSYTSHENMDKTKKVEFAFIGRSNVGKSSLINMIVGQKSLAKTSSKPGKTMLINEFIVNEEWTLIDLPGYGYAKHTFKKRAQFEDMICDYLKERQSLMCAFVLIDGRIPPQAIDLEFLEWCAEHEVPIALIFTKCDKLSKTKLALQTETFKAALYQRGWESIPPSFITSSAKRMGREELLSYLKSLLKI